MSFIEPKVLHLNWPRRDFFPTVVYEFFLCGPSLSIEFETPGLQRRRRKKWINCFIDFFCVRILSLLFRKKLIFLTLHCKLSPFFLEYLKCLSDGHFCTVLHVKDNFRVNLLCQCHLASIRQGVVTHKRIQRNYQRNMLDLRFFHVILSGQSCKTKLKKISYCNLSFSPSLPPSLSLSSPSSLLSLSLSLSLPSPSHPSFFLCLQLVLNFQSSVFISSHFHIRNLMVFTGLQSIF